MYTTVLVLLCLACPLPLGGEAEVPGHHHVAGRVRREVERKGLTREEKQDILDLHNKYRREEAASDMTIMQWHSGLERMAQDWADQCNWEHSEDRYNSDFRYIGENLYAKTALPSALDIVKDWNDERANYNYYTQQCSGVCGHYTQIVWAESEYLGCGVRFCPRILGLSWDRYGGGYLVVCNYGPGGNIIGQKPYTRAEPSCSACPRTHKYCIHGLCSKFPPSPTPTTSSPGGAPVPVEVPRTTRCPVAVHECPCENKEIKAISASQKTQPTFATLVLVFYVVMSVWLS